MSVRYERKDHIITTITVDDEGHVSRRKEVFRTTNAAKRTSHSLQMKAVKALGRGVLKVLT